MPAGSIRRTVLAAVALGVLAAAGPAMAATPKPVVRGSTYLALGDSVTFGFEEPQVVPAPDYARASSLLGYPEDLGAELGLKVVNAACPGETSASLIDKSAKSLGCENRYRARFPLHVHYSGSQLAFAVRFLKRHPDTRLVSLMIGANDAFMCEQNGGCTTAAERRAVLAKISRNTRRIFSAIRHEARYHGHLAIVEYYSLDYSSPAMNAFSQSINQAMREAGRRFGVVVADGFRELRVAAVHSGGSTCNAGLLTQLGKPGDCGIHPSFAGQALLADALLQAITT
jgi:lysophospholipase L1-like esterase